MTCHEYKNNIENIYGRTKTPPEPSLEDGKKLHVWINESRLDLLAVVDRTSCILADLTQLVES
jgi:hypothetical protein